MEAVEIDAPDTVEVSVSKSSRHNAHVPTLICTRFVTSQGNDILESLNATPAIVSKKGKQQLKHEAFIDRTYEA